MRTSARLVAFTALLLAARPQVSGIASPQHPAAAPDLERQIAGLVPAASPVLTPRPASVAGVATPIISLNGTWGFSSAEGVVAKPIEVPGEWAMQGFEVPSGGFATYTREIDVPADWRGRTVKLRFDAVHAVCEVLINGQAVGGHEGGFVPFELDVTKAVRPGRNAIVVRVQSESIADSISCISQYAAHQVGGIIRKVTLFCVPRAHVARLWFETAVTGGDASVAIHTSLAAGSLPPAAIVTHRLVDASQRVVASGDGRAPLVVRGARLWTSETPDLYTLETTLSSGGRVLQTLRQRIGLREVRVSGNRLLVNGRPVKLLGINRHEVHPLRGRSLTPALNRRDAELFRAANVNLVRTSHYPPSEEFLDACDELGIFVESEAAVCWIAHGASPIWKTWNHLDPKYFPYFLRATLDNIAAHRNHPSVLIWSLGNESLWTPLFAKVLEVAKHDDPSRPFTFHDQTWGTYNNAGSTADIANYHYPGENNADEWSRLPRPVWFGEYAHLQCYNRRELAADPWIREDWGRPLARMVDLLWQQPGALGGAIWSGVDDVFHMPNGDLKGYGHWGPIDGWRRQKPEWLGMKNAYTPFRVLKSDAAPGQAIALTVQNRFNFTNLSDVRIAWALNGRDMGVASASLAPHATGVVVIPASGTVRGDRVSLIVSDLRGVEVARDEFTVGGAAPRDGSAAPATAPGGLDPMAALAEAAKGMGLGADSFPKPLPMVLPLNRDGGAATAAGTQLVNEIEPFTPLPPDSVVSGPERRGPDAVFTVSAADVSGTVSMRPAGRPGAFDVSYRLEVLADVNPRQWGLVFTLPREFDTLQWSRDAAWTWYPADHIGRPEGTARANPVARRTVEEPRVALSAPWSLDANALGTNDFRSTKARIHEASLSAAGGRAWQVTSADASQSVRAWVDGNRIRVLVAGFNTGGNDQFFATHYGAERRPLKKGDVITSAFRLVVGFEGE
jgi:hypothetical protein